MDVPDSTQRSIEEIAQDPLLLRREFALAYRAGDFERAAYLAGANGTMRKEERTLAFEIALALSEVKGPEHDAAIDKAKKIADSYELKLPAGLIGAVPPVEVGGCERRSPYELYRGVIEQHPQKYAGYFERSALLQIRHDSEAVDELLGTKVAGTIEQVFAELNVFPPLLTQIRSLAHDAHTGEGSSGVSNDFLSSVCEVYLQGLRARIDSISTQYVAVLGGAEEEIIPLVLQGLRDLECRIHSFRSDCSRAAARLIDSSQCNEVQAELHEDVQRMINQILDGMDRYADRAEQLKKSV